MKKILFLQHKGSTIGGVWSVNKTLAEEFIKKGYHVTIASVRESFNPKYVPDEVFVYTINPKDKWEVENRESIINELKSLNLNKALDKVRNILNRKKDIKKLKDFIIELKPDYIISSHYQVLDGIPESYLKRTTHVHHSAFLFALSNKSAMQTLYKYNGKIKYCWLSKGTLNCAKKHGLKNNICIYNPVRFIAKKRANVEENKKLIVLTRLSEEKRIGLMVSIVEDIFKNQEFKDWNFEIYGEGNEEAVIKKNIKNKKQIKLVGRTDDAKECYLSSSINLSTSKFEGFSMSILEAQECGVPTISFDFGESAKEQILNGITGFIITMNNIDEFKDTLIKIMKNKNLLNELSENCRKNSKNFHPNNIILSWEKVFNLIDKED